MEDLQKRLATCIGNIQEAADQDFEAATSLLQKILNNVVEHPGTSIYNKFG